MLVLSVPGVLDKRRKEMNKEDLVKLVSEKTGITKKTAEQAQKAAIEGISSTLEKGDSISLVGFGSFKVVQRAAREGRNPSTGEKMQIPASKAVKFTPSKLLKERVQ
jgi:DNA-binding protein HU-beta